MMCDGSIAHNDRVCAQRHAFVLDFHFISWHSTCERYEAAVECLEVSSCASPWCSPLFSPSVHYPDRKGISMLAISGRRLARLAALLMRLQQHMCARAHTHRVSPRNIG